ncbi:MAG: hypothetical protein Q9163_005132 [Psora crenata]
MSSPDKLFGAWPNQGASISGTSWSSDTPTSYNTLQYDYDDAGSTPWITNPLKPAIGK